MSMATTKVSLGGEAAVETPVVSDASATIHGATFDQTVIILCLRTAPPQQIGQDPTGPALVKSGSSALSLRIAEYGEIVYVWAGLRAPGPAVAL
jgi:hypothetical protein